MKKYRVYISDGSEIIIVAKTKTEAIHIATNRIHPSLDIDYLEVDEDYEE